MDMTGMVVVQALLMSESVLLRKDFREEIMNQP
jgi:hypothetical protein